MPTSTVTKDRPLFVDKNWYLSGELLMPPLRSPPTALLKRRHMSPTENDDRWIRASIIFSSTSLLFLASAHYRAKRSCVNGPESCWRTPNGSRIGRRGNRPAISPRQEIHSSYFSSLLLSFRFIDTTYPITLFLILSTILPSAIFGIHVTLEPVQCNLISLIALIALLIESP